MIPIWARWMLTVALLGDRRVDVQSDLVELFGDRRARYGRFHAHRRLFSDIVSLWRGGLRGGTTLQDLRFGLRLLRKHPIPVGVTIAGLALTIGLVTSVFSIINASTLRPYGMDDPASIVSVTRPISNKFWAFWPYSQFLQMRDGSTLAAVEAALSDKVRFSSRAADEDLPDRHILFVSGGYLQMLGGRPALGRALDPSDDTPGAPAVIVVSHRFWSTALNGDPSIVGKVVRVNGFPVTLVGVMRPEFTGPVTVRPSFWAPLATFDDLLMGRPFDPTSRALVEVIARLKPGVASRAARDSLATVLNRSTAKDSATTAGGPTQVVRLYSAASPIDGPEAGESYVAIACIFGVLALVLALACTNTANLLMAAAATRSREIGIRLALGASTGRLVRQMVSESLLLGLTAGGLGFLFAVWFAPLLRAMTEMSPEINATPDGRVFLFTVAVAGVCGFGAGLSPARHGARGNVLSALKSQGDSRGNAAAPSRLRMSFLGFQAAVSVLLLVSAALLARTAILMTRTDIGFDANKMLAVSLEAPRKGFDEAAYVRAALTAIREIPSVERASATQYQPFGHSVERDKLTHDGQSYVLYVNRSDADYFLTAGLHMVRGRAFTAEEAAREAPVALISESVARAFFRGTDPIGQSVSAVPTEAGRQAPATIIGVVADAIVTQLRSQSSGTIYRPISQQRSNTPSLIVRTANPGVTARAVEDALRRVDARVRPTTSIVRDKLEAYIGEKRMLASLAGPIAALALLLATLGVYGVTAFVVSHRMQEVSVRLALGASTNDVLGLLVKDSLRPVVIGLTIGLAAALGVSRVFASVLSGISPNDPLAIGVATAVLVAATLVAILVPANRIARTDPASVLRQI